MLSLYDLLGTGRDAASILAWSQGRDVPGMPRLSPAEARTLCESWEFNARPGQRWAPGPEFITDFEAGRGWGKNCSGREVICDAAEDPDSWGGEACIVGPEPTQTKNVCLLGSTGLFAAARRRADAGLGPGIAGQNWNDRVVYFEAPRGGGVGLTVKWAAASDPKSVHGMNVGLAWLDEFGVWNHTKRDEQGNNAWQALRPAIRVGRRKVVITQTPSRSREVRILQMNAERPECPACRDAHRRRPARDQWKGEVGAEPWRLPRSPQLRLHPMLNTRTTVPARECPACGAEVIARVRCVFGDTTDNPTLHAESREEAAAEVAAGTAAGRMRFAPRGEVDSGAGGTLVRYEDVLQLEVPDLELGRAGPVRDRWLAALSVLGADEVIVDVDPAVTTTESSDESGVVAACARKVAVLDHAGEPTGDTITGAVLLEDASVRPSEVESGAPSSVWAPRAYRRAVLWGARRIIVETNQGGEEVLSAVQDLVRGGLTEATALRWLREEYPEVSDDARLMGIARRLVFSAGRISVESLRRVTEKTTRLEWYGRTAALGRVEGDDHSRPWGRQAVLCCPWLGGALHWQAVLGQVTGYEPPREGAKRSGRPRKDRGDAAVSAAQMLLGVTEASAHEVRDPRQDSWLTTTAPR